MRDAAVKLKSPFAVIVYLNEDGSKLGTASYGKTMALCEKAGEFADYLRERAGAWVAKGK